MSKQAVKNFFAELANNSELKNQYKQLCERSFLVTMFCAFTLNDCPDYDEQRIITFAASRGYIFTKEELRYEREYLMGGTYNRVFHCYDYEPRAEPDGTQHYRGYNIKR